MTSIKRRKFSRKERESIAETTDGRCVYCAEPLAEGWHVEHVEPLCRGGTHSRENLRAACRDCNSRKGGRAFKGWLLARLAEWQKVARAQEVIDLRKRVQELESLDAEARIARAEGDAEARIARAEQDRARAMRQVKRLHDEWSAGRSPLVIIGPRTKSVA